MKRFQSATHARGLLSSLWLALCAVGVASCASLPPPATESREPAAVAKAPTAAPLAPGSTTSETKPSAAPPAATDAAKPATNAARSTTATNGAAGAAASAAGGVPSMPPSPPLRAFADVIKDAKEQKGLFTLWSKDEKVWIEVKPEQLDQLHFLQVNIARGVAGDLPPLFSNFMSQAIVLKRIGNTVQVLAKNFENYATPGTPLAVAVSEATSDSLLAAVPVLSQPHPERKSFLIEANPIFMSDLPMLSFLMDVVFRTGYSLDRQNSTFREISATDELITFDVNAHYATARIPTPPLIPTPFPMPGPNPVSGTPDPRSFFLGLYYSIRKLPDAPMRTRIADARIGHFNTLQWDFSDSLAASPRKYVIERWRLEKSDPAAALSEPKKPIVFWLDKNIPLEYRDTVKAGVLEWNKAFERIGFKDALRVEQQPDDADWNTNDATRASIRWVVDRADGATAVGPSTVDPRSGEILDADITIGNGWVSLPRRRLSEQGLRPSTAAALAQSGIAMTAEQVRASRDARAALARSFLSAAAQDAALRALDDGANTQEPNAIESHRILRGLRGAFGTVDQRCDYAQSALAEAGFVLDLMSLRAAESGAQADNAALDRAVHAILKDVVAHEVGHTLGLRHNFRASTIYSQAQINDPGFSRERGISGSVMDYNAFNVALNRERQGEIAMSTIGPYDYWAIEYAYKELPEAEERETLQRIASRSGERELAYATDQELFGDFDGMDPEVNARDIGGDPLEFAARRIQLSRELFDRLQTRALQSGESYDVLTRNVMNGMNELANAFRMASKYVGGVVYVRDAAGSARAPLTPVAADTQRAALKLIVDNLFAKTGFDFKPEFVSRLTDNALDRRGPPVDRSLDITLWALQAVTLDRLMSPRVADRIVSANAKLGLVKRPFTLDELHRTLITAIWGEIGADAPAARRALQREHVRRLANALTRPSIIPTAGGDVRALHRSNAKQLLARVKTALGNPRVSGVVRAHYDEVADTLESALRAQVSKTPG